MSNALGAILILFFFIHVINNIKRECQLSFASAHKYQYFDVFLLLQIV